MSESGFTTRGFEAVPNFQSERELVDRLLTDSINEHVYNETADEPLTDAYEALLAQANKYRTMLSQDLMPRAKEQTEQLILKILFELTYRDGLWDEGEITVADVYGLYEGFLRAEDEECEEVL